MKYSEIIKNVNIYGLEESIRGAKFSMATDVDKLNCELTPGIRKLGMTAPGEGHDQWETGIIVQFDLEFTIKAWTEAERYAFFNFVSSESTMHRITRFDLGKAYIKYVDPRAIAIMRELINTYNQVEEEIKHPDLKIIGTKEWDDMREEQNERYLQILYTNPAGMKLTARMTTNYRQLKTIYGQRRNHRLPEWQAFCDWIETLPHSELITRKEVPNG